MRMDSLGAAAHAGGVSGDQDGYSYSQFRRHYCSHQSLAPDLRMRRTLLPAALCEVDYPKATRRSDWRYRSGSISQRAAMLRVTRCRGDQCAVGHMHASRTSTVAVAW
jgi:predicted NAD/FAD-dependent oxidoreductase